MSDRPLLELRGVTAGYDPASPAIRGLDLEILKGEVSALVSLDMGGGKSTALKTAAGLLRPFEGQVLFDGEDIYEASFRGDQRFRARCAVVLEAGALLVNMSIWENVAFPLRYHGVQSGRELKLTVERLLSQ
ncbi:MAG TPA: ABC transporter ATP-binding protein, partial [Planctomycetes bacterium]|nr:ABC transporter ATP-binding protein [Planctomycetota bacterium]